MKRVYWRPNRISRQMLLYIGLVAVGGTLAIEALPLAHTASHQEQKLAAAELAHRGMVAIREARVQRGHQFDERFDPGQTGMIGDAMSPVTSLPSHLEAKQTSVNPNFAAAVVEMLVDAGVESGDVVAVGYTGSFPAFNTCVCAALESLGVQPLIVHSAASSQFGANHPQMMWLDMETTLADAGLISFRSQAATLGGFGDRARGMSDESKAMLRDAITRNGIPIVEVESLQESIEKRMRFYEQHAAGRPIKAYINVGGGAASIHGSKGRAAFGAGLTRSFCAAQNDGVDCVAARFAARGVPVIHVGNAVQLARRFGLPVAPEKMPAVGTGAVFTQSHPSRLIAGMLLTAVALLLRSYLWSGFWGQLGARLRATLARSERSEEIRVADPPTVELMV